MSESSTISVKVNAISKNYGATKALENVSFEVEKGELFGLIGPDGAGKTTLIRIIATLLLADEGNISLEGLDVKKDFKKIRNIIGYMPGRFSLYQDLSVEENLNFFSTVYGTSIEENYHLIKDIYIQLEPFKNRRAGKLSGGMKQKLALCCALIHQPKVLILDEPTTGVDAVSRKEFWEMLKRLKQNQITIIVSTPYMDEANLCDRVALIQGGQILNVNTPENINKEFKKTLFAIKTNSVLQLLQDIRCFPLTNSIYPFGEYMHFTAIDENNITVNLLKYLQSKNHQQIEIKQIKPNIEDCFMALMKK